MKITKASVARFAIGVPALAGSIALLVPFFSGQSPPLMVTVPITWLAFVIGTSTVGLMVRRTLLFAVLGLVGFPLVLSAVDRLGLWNGFARHPIDQWRDTEADSPTMRAVQELPFELTNDQLLVVAAFELDVPIVKRLLAMGANPNARLELYDQNLFADNWTLSLSPIGSDEWTPLQAVASSHREPQPKQPTANTSEALAHAHELKQSIDPAVIAERDRRRVEIATLLIDAGAGLDFDDGYGATALFAAIAEKYEPLALMLIERGANVNTQTHVYIDGPDNITPLHVAAGQPAIVAALLNRGADPHAQTSGGGTPLHWAARADDTESMKLLTAAGADPEAKNNAGNTPGEYFGISIESLGEL